MVLILWERVLQQVFVSGALGRRKEKSSIKNLNSKKGFTLVELLVVIGVLGILAAGLLATIDPLEQFRKGADSNRKTTALELVNALSRYYATKGVMPWAEAVPEPNCGVPLHEDPKFVVSEARFAGCLTALVNQGELKNTFPNQKDILDKLKIVETGTGTSTIGVGVCFNPESKAESGRAETKYYNFNPNDLNNPSCPANPGCTWCAK